MKLFRVISIIVMLVFINSCQTQATNVSQPTVTAAVQPSQQGYPGPGQVIGSSSGYPAPATPVVKMLTAFQAYQIALPYAQKWNPNSVLYYIPATYQQQINFGQSTETEGWFFMFKDPASPLEYYIYITEGKFGGAKEAQPIVVDKSAPYQFLPLPELSKMIDSDKFAALYMQHGGDKYLADNPKAIFNSQLTFLNGESYPIWRMYDALKFKENTILFAVNALTGEVVNP